MNRLLVTPLVGAVLLVSACSTTSSTSATSATAEGVTTTAASAAPTASGLTYPIVDTSQTACFSSEGLEIACPAAGEADDGQDAQTDGFAASYTDNGDGTVTDNVTGLVWTQSADTSGDGSFDTTDKLSMDASAAYCEDLTLADSSDWTLPTIKQLYSLMNFTGTDPSGFEGDDTSGLVPFIDTDYFDFDYGDTSSQERIIDSQYATSTAFVGSGDVPLLFGVNFADGRIKGYGTELHGSDKTFTVACIEANTTYGVNDFQDNGDGTITDSATGLTWSQDDSGTVIPDGMNWAEALAWVEEMNASEYEGYSDWRLPNVKELQSIVDYTRSPETDGTAAIDPLFNSTGIINEDGDADFGYYWSSTTHVNWTDTPGAAASYVAFGQALGYENGAWTDVHGAGAQRSDPKQGDAADYPEGNGPQGDAIRIDNMVRLVRG